MSPLAGAALFAVLLVALVVGFLLVMTFNSVIALRTRIDKAWGNVEVALKQRYDQLAELVAAVRDLMARAPAPRSLAAVASAFAKAKPKDVEAPTASEPL